MGTAPVAVRCRQGLEELGSRRTVLCRLRYSWAISWGLIDRNVLERIASHVISGIMHIHTYNTYVIVIVLSIVTQKHVEIHVLNE